MGDKMNIIMLRRRIYDLKYTAKCYYEMSLLTASQELEKQMLNFQADCLNNMQRLVKEHQNLIVSPYDPIITDPIPFSDFKQSCIWMLKNESQLYRMFIEDCYQQYSMSYTTLANYISEVENHHTIYLTHCIFN